MASLVAAELVFIPCPGLGHIRSTVEIAKVLVNRDQRLSVTILVIQPPGPSSGSVITAYIESLPKNTSINRISFVPLPQDEPPPMGDQKPSMTSFVDFIKSHRKYVKSAVADLLSQAGSGRLAGFVVDMFCTCRSTEW
ncbi:hypothetical protein SSX86_021650 [Deinandra increscens subsp. villosa]|uniref:Uncharacterized protein n=1 Tax=Deinandra increscens subsp. villosa TaxID=3103831 RepID=A0AAP0CN39_9ASTR